jgi:hypothetical protein
VGQGYTEEEFTMTKLMKKVQKKETTMQTVLHAIYEINKFFALPVGK